ncbi:MAG TPA: hypothetical protein PKD58_02070, partial [Candidatus Sumerlaeota bacterium]|nr:hypothetical protein [Candidatus Sumerlaeota bacterium]
QLTEFPRDSSILIAVEIRHDPHFNANGLLRNQQMPQGRRIRISACADAAGYMQHANGNVGSHFTGGVLRG